MRKKTAGVAKGPDVEVGESLLAKVLTGEAEPEKQQIVKFPQKTPSNHNSPASLLDLIQFPMTRKRPESG